MDPTAPDHRTDVLRRSRDELRAAGEEARNVAEGLTADQLWWRPGPDRWSVGECLDHLVRADTIYRDVLEEKIREGRRQGLLADGPYRPTLVGRWLPRLLEPPPRLKVPATPRIRPRRPDAEAPDGRDEPDPLSAFLALRPRFAELLEGAEGLDLREIRVTSPFVRFVKFDLGSAFRVVAAHDRRHLWQARQVREEPGFPEA